MAKEKQKQPNRGYITATIVLSVICTLLVFVSFSLFAVDMYKSDVDQYCYDNDYFSFDWIYENFIEKNEVGEIVDYTNLVIQSYNECSGENIELLVLEFD